MQETNLAGFDGPVILKLGLRTTSGDQFYNVWLKDKMVAVVGSNRLTAIQKLIARKNTYLHEQVE